MKRKFAAIIMVLLMTFSVAVMSGCSNDGADGNPDQPPATEGDNSLGEDLKDDADKAGDDIKDDADKAGDDIKDDADKIGDDIKDGAEDIGEALDGDEAKKDMTDKN